METTNSHIGEFAHYPLLLGKGLDTLITSLSDLNKALNKPIPSATKPEFQATLDKVYEEYKTTIRDLVSNLNAQVTCTNKCIVNMTDVLNNHTDTALIDLNNILSIFTVYQTTNGPLLAQKRALDESLALVEGKIASLINSNVSLEIKTRSD